MLVSAPGLAGTTDPVQKPIDQSTSPEASSTEVLISTQQVAFGTAAALGTRRESVGGRFVTFVRRVFATPTEVSAARPRHHHARHYAFLEQALMAREMERL
jgi:hypothetical protein